MHPRQAEWIGRIRATGCEPGYYPVHLVGGAGTLREPIERMLQLTGGGPVIVDELSPDLSSSPAEVARQIPLRLAECREAGASAAGYVPIADDGRSFGGGWAHVALVKADGTVQPGYGVLQEEIATAKAGR
jgi:hypothetical protein